MERKEGKLKKKNRRGPSLSQAFTLNDDLFFGKARGIREEEAEEIGEGSEEEEGKKGRKKQIHVAQKS